MLEPNCIRVHLTCGMMKLAFCSSLVALMMAGCTPGVSETPVERPSKVTIAEFTDASERKEVITVDKVIKTEEHWRQQLTPQQFTVTRKHGTEIAFTGKLWNNH